MFYNEQGRHVRTKKEILDGDGNIRQGCKIIKKVRCMNAKFSLSKMNALSKNLFRWGKSVLYGFNQPDGA